MLRAAQRDMYFIRDIPRQPKRYCGVICACRRVKKIEKGLIQ